MSATYDLHLHSNWSYDAMAPVDYYFGLAYQKKMRAISITDHHTMDGTESVLAASRKFPTVKFFAGAELTVHCSLGSLDMVCLGLPLETPPELEEMFERYRQWQCATGRELSRVMGLIGEKFDDSDRLRFLQRYRPAEAISKQGVTHVNNELFQRELVKRGLLRRETMGQDYWEKIAVKGDFPDYPEASYVLPLVKKYGGTVFIAHPLHYFNRDDRNRMEALLEELQFDGVECAHTMFPAELTAVYRKFCQEKKLLSSGGTDCHSDPAHYYLDFALECNFGEHCGEDRWLDELGERIQLHGGC